jgi:hypothetical protein
VNLSTDTSYNPNINYAVINGVQVRVGADSLIGYGGVGIAEAVKASLENAAKFFGQQVDFLLKIGPNSYSGGVEVVKGWVAGTDPVVIMRSQQLAKNADDFVNGVITWRDFQKETVAADPFAPNNLVPTPPSLNWVNMFVPPPPLTIAPPPWAQPPVSAPPNP